MLIHVLLAVTSREDKSRLQRTLRQSDVTLAVTVTEKRFRERLRGTDFDLLVVHRSLLGASPRAVVDHARSLPERPEVVVLTDGDEDPADRTSLIAAGCMAVLSMKLGDDALREVFRSLVSRRRDQAIDHLRADRPSERYSLNDFVSDSPAMQVFLELARRVVHADSSLLLLGETGVGKERLARAIHLEGPRSAGPFIAVNCGAIPETLMESELFGHEEGAFTGASRARRGVFELAHRGTLLLDEIGEMPMHLQVKLLRALDDRSIRRVGGEKTTEIDVRVIGATHKDIETDVAEGRFRADLFYRLAVVTLKIPPLRERREDIVDLVRGYLEHFRAETRRQITSVGAEAMRVMTAYDWPGNVRELINAIERAFLMCTTDEIRAEDLPVRIVQAVDGNRAAAMDLARAGDTGNLPEDLLDKTLSAARKDVTAAFETRYVRSLLNATGGRIRETAARAGINERSLYDLMKRHGLRKEDYKARPAEIRPRSGSRLEPPIQD